MGMKKTVTTFPRENVKARKMGSGTGKKNTWEGKSKMNHRNKELKLKGIERSERNKILSEAKFERKRRLETPVASKKKHFDKIGKPSDDKNVANQTDPDKKLIQKIKNSVDTVGSELQKKSKKSKLHKLKEKKRKMKKLGIENKEKVIFKSEDHTKQSKQKKSKQSPTSSKKEKDKDTKPLKQSTNEVKKDKATKLSKQAEQKRLKDPEILSLIKERLDKRDNCKLYIKGNLKKLPPAELLTIVPGINDVQKLSLDATFAFIEFHSHKLAKKGFKLLQDLKVEGQSLEVKLWQPRISTKNMNADPNILSVEGLPPDTQVDDIKAVFPTSANIRLPINKGFRYLNYAHIKFLKEEDAKKAFLESNKAIIKGQVITVLYAKFKPRLNNRGRGKKKRKNKKSKKPKPAKSMGNDGVDKKPKIIKFEIAEDKIEKKSKKIKQELFESVPRQNKKIKWEH